MKRVVLFRSPSYTVGVSPTSFPAWACGTGSGGGPHAPPGGPPGGTPPPPGYPPPPGSPPPPPGNPPPLGNPPPGNPPLPGNLLAGWSSCGSLIGGNSGSCSGPPLGGSALSGPPARLNVASSSTTFVILLIRCPVSSWISSSMYGASVMVAIAGGLI